MSIRLHLTLIYTAILALTLIVFSSLLYYTQSQATLNEHKDRLAVASRFAATASHSVPAQDPARPRRYAPKGMYVQFRDLSGSLLGTDPNLDDVVLPLSDDGQQALQSANSWVETVSTDTERFLVHNQVITLADDSPAIAQLAVSLSDRDSALGLLRIILVAGSSIAVVAAFGIGWLISGFTLRPINRITRTAQAIGVEQDFSRRVDHAGPNDEIGQLVRTFNDMLSQLEAAYLQSEQSLQGQRRFVADASHELRTPLTTIRGNIALLQHEPPLSDEDRIDILSDMEDETERLIRLVNDLLALARADAKQPLRRELVDMGLLLADVQRQVQRLDARRVIMLETAANAIILGDRDLLKQLLLILLDNAVTHTPSETMIDIKAEIVEAEIVVSISDDGPGIAEEKLSQLFTRFYRGDAARTGPGSGLGLAIAKALVEVHNGVIAVESEVGRGSTFTVRFPTYQAARPETVTNATKPSEKLLDIVPDSG